jgi:hypothetical protein
MGQLVGARYSPCMSLSVLDARETDHGVAITFITEKGLEPLEGTHAEVARLAEVMRQVSVLASANDDERVWLEDVVVGDAVVQLGINPHGQARVRILRP